MSTLRSVLAWVVAGSGPWITFAAAGNPTMSLEVVSINNIEVDPPQREIAVAPGDAFTAKLFLRDWSPDGERLRAYQATVMHQGYTSGDSGFVKPLGYDDASAAERPNPHVRIEKDDPAWVFHGYNAVAITDTISADYRLLGVLADQNDALLAPQDGTRFVGGTIPFEVSGDAAGTFDINLNTHEVASVLKDPYGNTILPRDFEHLVVHVGMETADLLRISGSGPPAGVVDARWRLDADGRFVGCVDAIAIHFRAPTELDAAGVRSADFVLHDGTDNPPTPTRFTTVPSSPGTGRLVLERGIRAGHWTTVTHIPSNTHIRLGCLPGDISGDGRLSTTDLLELIEGFQADSGTLPAYRYDMNGDGIGDPADVLHMVELLNQPHIYKATMQQR